jgi:hypothetical protein
MVAGLIQPPSWIASVVGVWHQHPAAGGQSFFDGVGGFKSQEYFKQTPQFCTTH